MVEKGTFDYLETALVDIPAVSMPVANYQNLRHMFLAFCCVTKLFILEKLAGVFGQQMHIFIPSHVKSID